MNTRDLRFTSVPEVIADVKQLQAGNTQLGNWTLPQACWHLGLAIEKCLHEIPLDAASTPEQLEMQRSRLVPLAAAGKMPPGQPMPKGTDPLREAPGPLGADRVDQFINELNKLNHSSLPKVEFGAFGVVTMDQFRQFILIHSANHLGHFAPT